MAWKFALRCPTKPAMDIWEDICTNKERLLTVHVMLHSTSHRDNLVSSVMALVVPVTRVINLSVWVQGDGLVKVVDWVSFSCWLYMQVKQIKRATNYTAYLLSQRLNWHQRQVMAETTWRWHSLIGSLICHGMSTLWGRSRWPRLSLGNLAFACTRFAKLLAATVAEINNCFPRQNVSELQKYWVST